ncbi:type II toxin-antitoxin system RelE/ParE family toxin [Rhizobium sp. SSA_523]|uniref:type II toxin-antitoxin system RelE/ParE family toxin n=1 Tax=Rhizobium sp. SSA_523 TaxID=2952477 RepID=UPI002090E07F|nr:type II toxin-antitoxin system RelE/ParE family toxin [Rhizobium sp. SSA_523]MCO5730945.1 type II toxin-antitoxin system RelE/ParE family toxin [Rhizobium sp. SSA_523]WKC24244.1 type II toxin-antitoxin system RelE/ParE family toxin [Rhizobium sp. SSA_523]
MSVRVLKDVEFHNWAVAYDVTDATLCVAAREIENGLIDARLGGFLLKKRVAAPGRGKSGSYRTLVGHRQADRLIFVHGFAKNEADNISKSEKLALRKLCDIYMLADNKTLAEMIGKNAILEIDCHEPHTEERPHVC